MISQYKRTRVFQSLSLLYSAHLRAELLINIYHMVSINQ
jgi:hypothetical protein